MLNGERIVVEQVQHELLESPVTVYNFEVEGFHTYYVGDTEVLVHNTCGQNHHAISNKINREKIKNHNLDCISRNDPRFQVRALTPEGHRGYQRWHREYDDAMVKWLRDNPDATADAFINKLNEYYAKYLQSNFGKVNFKL